MAATSITLEVVEGAQRGRAFTFDGHVITGGVASTTVTATLQVLEFPASSVAVKATMFVPRASNVPGGGSWVIQKLPQLSLAVTWAVRSGRSARQVASAGNVWFVAQAVMTGAVASTIWRAAGRLRARPHSLEMVSL